MTRQVLAGLMVALGLACGTALAVSVIGLPAGVARLWPACPAKLAGGRCALCGMRHSFAAMSRGRWAEAAAWNPAGPWLYGGFVLQAAAGLAGAVLLARRSQKKRNYGSEHATRHNSGRSTPHRSHQ